jgi:hypothetical protein
MSAFVVSDKHINTLITWAYNNKVQYYKDRWVDINQTPTHAANTLYAENVRSVNSRYNERSKTQYDRFRFVPVQDLPDAIGIIKLCHCLQYQSCEHKGWDKSEAKKLLQAIEEYAMRALPGFEKAYNAAEWSI